MIRLFGQRTDDRRNDAPPQGSKFSRFEPEHSRVRAVASSRTPHATAQHLVQSMRQDRPVSPPSSTPTISDHLHSEIGLSPEILRRALPMRFRRLDSEKTKGLGQDFFEFAAS